MQIKFLSVAACLALGLAACGDQAPTPTTETPTVSAPAPASTPAATDANTTTATSASTSAYANAPSCDQYLKEYEACFAATKLPPEAIAAARQGLDATRKAWEQAAMDANQSAALEASCKQVLDALPQTKAAMGC
jgi:hypothetical protein